MLYFQTLQIALLSGSVTNKIYFLVGVTIHVIVSITVL